MDINKLCKKLGLDTDECHRGIQRYGANDFEHHLEEALDRTHNKACSHGAKYKITEAHLVPATKQNLNGTGDCDAFILVSMMVDKSLGIHYRHPIPYGKGYNSSSI